MTTTNKHQLTVAACIALAAVAATGCGGGDATSEPAQPTTTTGTTGPSSLAPKGPTTSATSPTASAGTDLTESTEAQTTRTTVDDSWLHDAAAVCAAYVAENDTPPPDITTAGIVAFVDFFRQRRERLPSLGEALLPELLRSAPSDVAALWIEQDQLLLDAEMAAAAGDIDAAVTSIEHFNSLLLHIGALLTVAGAECGDPARAANAALNVPIPSVHQVATGFGSVWAGPAYGTSILRVDPASGEVLAAVDVGAQQAKAQPADGRMIVRTADAYTAIDPATNTVVAMLPKADVGPAANRSWAVDGAVWICDGPRLHRFDPATLEPTGTVIELGIDCGQVTATTELVVAWSYNEDDGESGTSAAAFIDPATNEVLATVDLPADVTVPIVLDDTVFLPANKGTQNVVVDRATWAVTATPDYGREIGGSQMAFDGRSIYLMADGVDVLVIDAQSYELVDVLEPLTITDRINALAVGPGALWVATGDAGILQRFDIP